MAYTKDDIIAYQDETLDNIEALLNLKVGSKVKSDEGDIYMIGTSIAFDIEVDYYLINTNHGLVSDSYNSVGDIIVKLLRDNFLGNDNWTIVE